jgi:filamentous hemagglutinin family protein
MDINFNRTDRYRRLRDVPGLATVFLFLFVSSSSAQITLDGSLGTGGSLAGPNFVIPSSVGQTRGGNLFHSFGLFNVNTGESATFTGPNTINNILGRVTGGQQSTVNGLLRSDIQGANLYLINPAGLVFGPNASLDIKGSFHVSTADYLKFAEGAMFHANLARESVLTTAAVSAFGFLSPTPAPISMSSVLAVPQGQTLSVIGGKIDLTGGSLRAPAGRINIGSVASVGEVVPNPAQSPIDLNVDSFVTLGDISLSGTVVTASSAAGGGVVVIRGGRFALDQGGAVAASTTGSANGAPAAIDVRVTENLTLTNNSQLVASSTAAGGSGDIMVNAGSLEAQRGGRIVVSASGAGNSGHMNVRTDQLNLHDGGFLLSSTTRLGNGGNIDVQAKDLLISNTNFNGPFTGIAAETAGAAGTGKAGNVNVATDSLIIKGGSRTGTDIHSTTFSAGPGGTVDITANDIVVSGTAAAPFATGIFASALFGSGSSGDLNISANSIKMTDHARAQTLSVTAGNAGNMTVTAGDVELRDGSNFGASSLFGTGNAGRLNVTANNLLISGNAASTDPLMNDFTGLTTATTTGLGSDLNVVANNIQVLNQGFITSTTAGAGNAGDVNIFVTGNLDVSGRSAIISGTTGSGNAGDLNVQVRGALSVTNGGNFIAGSQGQGAGGAINLSARQIIVSGVAEAPNDTVVASFIGSQAGPSAGGAGNVQIHTDSLQVLDGGRISAETFGSSNAGTINIQAQDVLVSGINKSLEDYLIRADFNAAFAAANISSNSSLLQQAVPVTGNAGTVFVNTNNLTIENGGKILGGSSTAGKGGNLDLRAKNITLNNQALVSASSSGTGDAGDIRIVATKSLKSVNSSITSRTETADGGNIHLTVGQLVELVDSRITTSVQGGQGKGGNITIDPPAVILNNSDIAANAFGGPGGNVTIIADVFLASADSSVTVSSELNTQGTVDIQAPIIDLSGSLAPLPENVLQAAALMRQSCPAKYSGGKLSSLVAGSREGLPLEPGSFLTSPLVPNEGQSLFSASESERFASAASLSTPTNPLGCAK